MKKNYSNPKLIIKIFETQDIICNSLNTTEDLEDWFAPGFNSEV